MKKLFLVCVVLALAADFLQAAQVEKVIVHQQWPWTTDVKVEYKVSGATNSVDVGLRVWRDATEIDAATVKAAAKGDLFGVTSGVGTILLDPEKLFGGASVSCRLKVELSLTESASNVREIIYKIYDLESGACTDVTRADILGGKYGTYETSFSKIGAGYQTSVQDVLIWTGVTNDEQYATTKLVLRKIPAGAFTMGSPTNEAGRVTAADRGTRGPTDDGATDNVELQHSVTLTKDYWMGVFEITQAQYANIVSNNFSEALTNAWPSFFTEASSKATRPVDMVSYYYVRGLLSENEWPADHAKVSSWSFLALLRARLNGSPLIDLPTEAQWEYACRAGTTTALYTGADLVTPTWDGDAGLTMIARTKLPDGFVNGVATPTADTSAADGGTARVGSYRPNAYGLYDMVGNVSEWCLDWYEDYTSEAVTDPVGPARRNTGYWRRSIRGGNWAGKCRFCRSASRGDFSVDYNDRNPSPTYSKLEFIYGFRVCLTEAQ